MRQIGMLLVRRQVILTPLVDQSVLVLQSAEPDTESDDEEPFPHDAWEESVRDIEDEEHDDADWIEHIDMEYAAEDNSIFQNCSGLTKWGGITCHFIAFLIKSIGIDSVRP